MMDRNDYIPADYKRITVVDNMSAFFTARFGGRNDVNCILYPRRLSQDFNGLAESIAREKSFVQYKHVAMTPSHLRDSAVEQLRPAAEQIAADAEKLSAMGATFAYVSASRLDHEHVLDSDNLHLHHAQTNAFGRIVCCYNDPSLEWARNDDVDSNGAFYYGLRQETSVYRFGAGDMIRFLGVEQTAEQVAQKSGDYKLFNGITPFIYREPTLVREHRPCLQLISGGPS